MAADTHNDSRPRKKKMQGAWKRTVRKQNIIAEKNVSQRRKNISGKNTSINRQNAARKSAVAKRKIYAAKSSSGNRKISAKKKGILVSRKRSKNKGGNFKRFCLTGIASALLCSVAGFLLWYLSFENLSLENYVAVTYSGYNTEGTAQISLQESQEYESFLKTVDVRLLTQNGNLKNGDVLDIQFIYDEETAKASKFRIESDDCLVKVEGLPEGRQLSTEDLFRDIHICYEGIAPKLSLSVSNNSTDPFLQTITYRILDQKTYYDIQDTFLVEAVFSEKDAIINEYIIPSSEDSYCREFHIEETDRYIRDTSQISQEQIDVLN